MKKKRKHLYISEDMIKRIEELGFELSSVVNHALFEKVNQMEEVSKGRRILQPIKDKISGTDGI